ncbi:MAG: hypothetical protein U5L11_04525 [Arhodomonas sp.]|nr:hypothetical protein [Arhodomonas sp.]
MVRAIRRLRPFTVEIMVDELCWQGRALHVSVGNGRFYGGGIPVQTDAAIDDGRLDAYCVPPRRGLGLLGVVRDVARGGLPGSPVWRASGVQATVNTRRHRRIMADGEYIALTPATFHVVPAALQVIVPAEVKPTGLRSGREG